MKIMASSITLDASGVIGWYTFKSFQRAFLVGYVNLYPEPSFFSCIAIEPMYIHSFMMALAYATIHLFGTVWKILILLIDIFIFLKCFLLSVFLYQHTEKSYKISEFWSSLRSNDVFWCMSHWRHKKVRYGCILPTRFRIFSGSFYFFRRVFDEFSMMSGYVAFIFLFSI